ncbi:hypothetical protein FACS1894208_10220 [Clostridia bacterium]|nr:hypothetical protein FACS1894208_10220 [Clostridia bacterium]
MRDFRVVLGDCNVGAHAEGFSALFGIQQGGLTSLVYDGKERLCAVPRVTFWRAPTDNDNGANFGFTRGIWKLASLYQKLADVQYAKVDGNLEIEYFFELPTSTKTTVRYVVTSDGNIHVTATVLTKTTLTAITAQSAAFTREPPRAISRVI